MEMFLSVLIYASLNKSTVFVEHPQVSMNVPAIVGKVSTPTPTGVFEVRRAFSPRLNSNILIFKQDDSGVYAIHPVVDVKGQNRRLALVQDNPNIRKLSGGCINLDKLHFDKLWDTASKTSTYLQVY